MKKLVALITLILLSVGQVNAQMKEGHIKYKIKMDLEDEKGENAMVMAMMKNATLEVYFKGTKTRAEFSLGAMMSMTTVTDSKSEDMLMLMNGMMMGKKAIKTTMAEMEAQAGDSGAEDKVDVKLVNETKVIEGYKCKKAIITMEEGVETVFWYTDKIEVNKKGQSYLNEHVPGFPMEFEMNQGGTVVTMTVTSVEDTVGKKADKLFDMSIPSGYEEMSMEDLNPGAGE